MMMNGLLSIFFALSELPPTSRSHLLLFGTGVGDDVDAKALSLLFAQ